MKISGSDYEFHPLPYDDALIVAAELAGALLPSLGAIAEGPLGAMMSGTISVEDLMSSEVSTVFKDVRPVEISRMMAESLRRGDLRPDMIRRALSSTTRNGITLEGPAFDAAYRGNLNESFVAAWYAMSANGLFSWPSTSDPGKVAGPVQ